MLSDKPTAYFMRWYQRRGGIPHWDVIVEWPELYYMLHLDITSPKVDMLKLRYKARRYKIIEWSWPELADRLYPEERSEYHGKDS